MPRPATLRVGSCLPVGKGSALCCPPCPFIPIPCCGLTLQPAWELQEDGRGLTSSVLSGPAIAVFSFSRIFLGLLWSFPSWRHLGCKSPDSGQCNSIWGVHLPLRQSQKSSIPPSVPGSRFGQDPQRSKARSSFPPPSPPSDSKYPTGRQQRAPSFATKAVGLFSGFPGRCQMSIHWVTQLKGHTLASFLGFSWGMEMKPHSKTRVLRTEISPQSFSPHSDPLVFACSG